MDEKEINKSNVLSLPSRERGLKFKSAPASVLCANVAPLAGAWIEIHKSSSSRTESCVAPLAGAWIEILRARQNGGVRMSLPSRERGLKYPASDPVSDIQWSLPSRERGLKLIILSLVFDYRAGRSPRGSVD